MSIDWIDHVVVPVKSLSEASAAYERLGLKLTPVTRHKGLGTENRVFFVGDGTNDFYIELLAVHDRVEAAATERGKIYLRYMLEERGIARLMLGTNDISATVRDLQAKGVHTEIETVSREGGGKMCDVAALEGVAGLGINAGLIQYVEAREESHKRRAAAGYFTRDFPLKRLDHLAVVTPKLQATERVWTDILGVTVCGEVKKAGLIIRQMKIGNAILELLSPEGSVSPLINSQPGLSSTCVWEVPVLDDAVSLAHARGFSPSEPRVGVLPGTRVSIIPGSELAGVGMQLLEYV